MLDKHLIVESYVYDAQSTIISIQEIRRSVAFSGEHHLSPPHNIELLLEVGFDRSSSLELCRIWR